MNDQRANTVEPEKKEGAPKYIVSYSAMVTILLAFFIMLNNLATVQECGLIGAGLGAFRKSFNSVGLPGVLPGSSSHKSFLWLGGKYVPEETTGETEGNPSADRLIDPPERDLEDTVNSMLKVESEVMLPLPQSAPGELNAETRARLASVARLIRRGDCNVHVCASMPEKGDLATAWRSASKWASEVGRYLRDREHIAPERIIVIGRLMPPPEKGQASPEPTLGLVLQSRGVGDESFESSLGRNPGTVYERAK